MSSFWSSKKHTKDYGKLSDDQKKQLKKILPVQADNNLQYYRCDMTLNNGELRNRVYLIEAGQFLKHWSRNFKTGYDDIFISINDIVKIEKSKYCLPHDIAEKIYAGGESAMGGTLFVLVFRDGTEQSYGTGNLIDFVQLPEDKTMEDIVDVRLHEGRTDPNRLEGENFFWCVYSE